MFFFFFYINQLFQLGRLFIFCVGVGVVVKKVVVIGVLLIGVLYIDDEWCFLGGVGGGGGGGGGVVFEVLYL